MALLDKDKGGGHGGEMSHAHPLPAGEFFDVAALPRGEPVTGVILRDLRSEEHTSELQSLMRISYAVFCLKKKITIFIIIDFYFLLPSIILSIITTPTVLSIFTSWTITTL